MIVNCFIEKLKKKMPSRPEITLTREELERAEIPLNHVLIKITRRAEGLATRAGVVIGYNEDTVYAEGDDSHSANLAENIGYVAKVPHGLYFNPEDPKSMDWETEMELQIGDMVFFSLIESKNSVQLICDGVLYKSVPYSDCYCAKRFYPMATSLSTLHFAGSDPWYEVICLNGFVICSPCFKPKLSDLDHVSGETIDNTRAVIKFIGNAPKAYLRQEYSHIDIS